MQDASGGRREKKNGGGRGRRGGRGKGGANEKKEKRRKQTRHAGAKGLVHHLREREIVFWDMDPQHGGSPFGFHLTSAKKGCHD